MRTFIVALSFLILVLGAGAARAAQTNKTEASVPRLTLIDAAALAKAKARIAAKDAALLPARDALIEEADKALEAGPFTVTMKKITPPSGDKHDYMSLGTYWWPDPKKKDGLPYIRKDGRRNPETRKTDHTPLSAMNEAVQTLALAYALTGDEKYAKHGAELLRGFFLDAATKMNPNLNFAQAIPGINDGRGVGIIDTAGLCELPDAITLLAGSKSLTAADLAGLKEWFAKYLDWLLTSKNGKDEAKALNNHGSWYDAQVVAFALFVGQDELARKVAEEAKAKRIAYQVKPDGAQPEELARTNGFSYSIFNLSALLTLAREGRRVDVDLLGYTAPEGGSIRKAVEFLLPYAEGKKAWNYQQISGFKGAGLAGALLRAGVQFGDAGYVEKARAIGGEKFKQDRLLLLLNQ